MNVRKYFNQTAVYKKYKSTSGNGKKIYEEPEQIRLRLETSKQNYKDNVGNIQVYNAFYMVKKEGLQIGDLIIYRGKEYQIISVDEIIDKKARYIYSEGGLI